MHIGIVVSVPTSWLILWVQTDFASHRKRTTHYRGAFGFDDNAELKGSVWRGRELLSPHTARHRFAEAACGWLQRFSNACTYVRRCLLDGRACASLGHLQVYPRSLGRVHIGIVVSVPTSWLILWVQTDFVSHRRRTTHCRGAFGFDDNAELKGSVWRGRKLLSPHTARHRFAEAACGWLQRFSNACTYVRRCLLDGRACASLGHLQVYPRSLGRVHIGIVVSVPTSWLILWVQTDFASHRKRTTHCRGAFGFDDNAELKGSVAEVGNFFRLTRLVAGLLKPPVAGCSDSRSCTYVPKMSPRRASMRLAWAPSGVSEVTRSSAYRNRGLRAHVMVDLVGADRLCKPPQAHNALSRCFRLRRQRGIEGFGGGGRELLSPHVVIMFGHSARDRRTHVNRGFS